MQDLARELNVDIGLMKLSLREAYMNVLRSGAGETITNEDMPDHTVDISWTLACSNDVS